jgi:hypothetical protein
MAIAVATLANTPYVIPNPMLPKVYNAPPVFAYDWNATRVIVAPAAGTLGRTSLGVTANPAGDTIFLPFGQNEVHSVYLDTAAILLAGGITGFMTPNLSGCRIYIDKVVGTNNLVIYHANAVATGPYIKPGQVAPLNPPDPLDMDKETGIRAQALDTQYRTSKAYWAAPAGARPALNLTNVSGLGATAYYTSAVKKVQTEQAAGRTAIQFYGGVSVVGELIGGVWQIWWQTYGDCTYTGKTIHGGLNMQVLQPPRQLL